jgi:uncharacterized lipoprotein YddW (UPF0748 family)
VNGLRSHPAAASLLIAIPLLWTHAARAEHSPGAEQSALRDADAAARLALHGAARLVNEGAESELLLPKGAYAEWTPEQGPATDAGTFSMWVKPLWPATDKQSHTFATFKWSGADESYFALSQGWWEPTGQRKLHAVLSNQQYVACLMPWRFDYTLFLPDQWTLLSVTWQAGSPGYLRLFVDGKLICERRGTFTGGRHALNPIYLGSDRGAAVENRGRASDVIVRDIAMSAHAHSADDMRLAYLRGGGSDHPKWILAIAPGDPKADDAHERRLMLDEDTHWASSRSEIRRRIARIKSAGFNIYAPCVWDGAQAFYSATNAPAAPGIRDVMDPQYDPLAFVIALAHREGIAVHPWFIIARHPHGGSFPAAYLDGAPEGAFNVHSPEFRKFIAEIVLDVARRYDVDGINLDYVRAIGPCSNRKCIDAYAAKYGRELAQDWEAEGRGETVPSLIEWNRAAMTDIVSRISTATRKLKPNAVITIDTIPFDHYRRHQGVDEEGWLRTGLIDAMVDMAYDDPVDIDTLDQAMEAFTPGRQVVAVRDYDPLGDGSAARSGNVMGDYVRLIRTRWPGAGIAFYQYRFMSPEQIERLGGGVFGHAARSAWKH